MPSFLQLLSLLWLPVLLVPQQPDPVAIRERLGTLRLNTNPVVGVRDVTIQRNALTLTFTDGALAFLEPIGDRVTGVAFVGTGEVRLDPPDAIERQQLLRFTGSGELRETFSGAVLRFTDNTAEELRRELASGPAVRASAAQIETLSAWGATPDGPGSEHNLRILTALSGQGEHAFLAAALDGVNFGRFDVVYDEREREALRVSTPGAEPGTGDVWTRFAAGPSNPDPYPFDVLSYDMDGNLENSTELVSRAGVHVRFRWAGERLVRFHLSQALNVEAVSIDGEPATFFQEALDGAEPGPGALNAVIVVLPGTSFPGQDRTITFEYRGAVFQNRGRGILYVDERDAWYPRPDWTDSASFNVRMWVPRPSFDVPGHSLVIPARVSRSVIMGWTGLRGPERRMWERWTTTEDLFAPALIYGNLETTSAVDESTSVNVRVHNDPVALYDEFVLQAGDTGVQVAAFFGTAMSGRDPATATVAEIGLYEPPRLAQRILSEVTQQFNLIDERFGPYPFAGLNVLQFPAPYVNGSESVLNVSTLPFLDEGVLERLGLAGSFDPFSFEYTRALRIARQIFGNAIQWPTYRDRWLLDGLAGYAGVVYLEDRYPDTTRASAMLESLRGQLFSPAGTDADGAMRVHNDSGPVWLGPRLTSSGTPNGYVDTGYTKSVWIMHMLRTLMREPGADAPDAAFFRMIRDFVEAWDGRMPSTADFKAHVEAHMTPGMNLGGDGTLDWFFDQWVFSTGVPEYNVDFIFDETNGEVSGRVIHSQVANFVMPVPTYMVSRSGQQTYLGTVTVDDDGGDFRYAVETEPATIAVDPYNTILQR